MTLILRKLLASSTFAIAGALETMTDRLRKQLRRDQPPDLLDELDQDYEALDETAEEWPDDAPSEPLTREQREAIEAEISDLEKFTSLATSINNNAKGEALVKALHIAMAKARELGAKEKAIIFTESRKTQNYLLRVLADTPWKDGIVLFNGTNTDERSREIHAGWLAKHKGTDRVTGSRTADMRSALVDYFREQGQIMIATEAGAEGINLQFCSLVVNYDLPWNPQRIEQRIGRCHRYGQKHDVVVVNFLNRNNQADQRVYELLEQKFQLFEGVFGASDEVLGAIESGVDLEKRIADIYQNCRKPDEINEAFEALQLELFSEINEAMTQTRQKLLENFDDEVREKLRVRDERSKEVLSRFERNLIQLTRYELSEDAEFTGDSSFNLLRAPAGVDAPLGLYELPRRSTESHTYRLNHPLAEALIRRAMSRDLSPVELRLSYSTYAGRITILEPYVGRSGWLEISQLSVEALDQAEDHLIYAALTDEGQELDDEAARRLLSIPGNVTGGIMPTRDADLDAMTKLRAARVQRTISERNARFFESEASKLEGWAEDLKVGLEREIKELDRLIREARRAAQLAPTLEEKVEGQKQIRELEAQRNRKRRSLFDAQDEVDRQRDEFIANIEGKLTQSVSVRSLFSVRWVLE
jgi:adenine-specific DNA-methyltransferase